MLTQLINALPQDLRPDHVLVYFGDVLAYTILPSENMELADPNFYRSEGTLSGDLKIKFRDQYELSSDRLLFTTVHPIDRLVYHRDAAGTVLVDVHDLSPSARLAPLLERVAA